MKDEDKTYENEVNIRQENFIKDQKKNIEIVEVENKKTDRSNAEFDNDFDYIQEVKAIESLSIQDKELELIKKSLEKHKGKRKVAARELGISERTLYRKIKQFNL